MAIKLEVTLEGRKREIVVASAYMPYDDPEPPPSEDIAGLVENCRRKGRELIIGCDANSHHTVWGSTDINARGEAFLEYLAGTELRIINRSREPTFRITNRVEVVDLTLGTPGMADKIEGWGVSDEPSQSDHRPITFTLKTTAVRAARGPRRDPKTIDWPSYVEDLRGKMEHFPRRYGSEAEIDLVVEILRNAIIHSYENNCTPKLAYKDKIPWWNERLQELRAITRRSWNVAKATGNPWDWVTKTESWRRYCQEFGNTPEAARIQRVLRKDPMPMCGSLRKPTGGYTDSWREELDVMLGKHFPGYTLTEEWTDWPYHQCRHGEMDWTTAGRIVIPSRVRWAIRGFKPYKTAGTDGIFPALLQQGLEVVLPPATKILRACVALRILEFHAKTLGVTRQDSGA